MGNRDSKLTKEAYTAKITFAARLVAGLKDLGWREELGNTSKYRTFRKPGITSALFVGPAGALRAGEVVSRSRSQGDPAHQNSYYQAVLQRGDEALGRPPVRARARRHG